MRQEPPKSCPRAVQEATHRRLGAKTRHKAAPDSLQTSIFDHFGYDLEGFWNHFGWILGKIFKQIGSILSKLYPLAVLGGCAPPRPPPLLRGFHLEERTVAGTPLCGARDLNQENIKKWHRRIKKTAPNAQIIDFSDLSAHPGLNACHYHFFKGSVRGEAPHKNSGGSGGSKDFLVMFFYFSIFVQISI